MNWLVVLIVSLVVVGAITTWSPWLSEDEVLERARHSDPFAAQVVADGDQESPSLSMEYVSEDVVITRTPLGRHVAAGEERAFVWFWHGF